MDITNSLTKHPIRNIFTPNKIKNYYVEVSFRKRNVVMYTFPLHEFLLSKGNKIQVGNQIQNSGICRKQSIQIMIYICLAKCGYGSAEAVPSLLSACEFSVTARKEGACLAYLQAAFRMPLSVLPL